MVFLFGECGVNNDDGCNNENLKSFLCMDTWLSKSDEAKDILCVYLFFSCAFCVCLRTFKTTQLREKMLATFLVYDFRTNFTFFFYFWFICNNGIIYYLFYLFIFSFLESSYSIFYYFLFHIINHLRGKWYTWTFMSNRFYIQLHNLKNLYISVWNLNELQQQKQQKQKLQYQQNYFIHKHFHSRKLDALFEIEL